MKKLMLSLGLLGSSFSFCAVEITRFQVMFLLSLMVYLSVQNGLGD